MKYTVTITRQFGSLGRPIAHELSQLLGIKYYDRDIVEETSAKTNMPKSVISDTEERAKSRFWRMKYPLGRNTTDLQDQIFAVQKDTILDIYKKESAIIVGRCSDYILEDMEHTLHIYIYAPYRDRYRNCINALHMGETETVDMIHEVDRARDAYHMAYARYLPSDPVHKDLLSNSSMLGVEGTAKYLADLVKMKFRA